MKALAYVHQHGYANIYMDVAIVTINCACFEKLLVAECDIISHFSEDVLCCLAVCESLWERDTLTKRPPAKFRTHYPSTNLRTNLILQNIRRQELGFVLAIGFNLNSFLLNQLHFQESQKNYPGTN